MARMRKLSKKRAAENRAIDPARKAFLAEFPLCWRCRREHTTEIHEMTPAAGRRAGYQERCTWFATCQRCHSGYLQAFRKPYDLAGQLALKLKHDLDYYDRLRVLEIKGLAPTAVTQVEVIQAAYEMRNL